MLFFFWGFIGTNWMGKKCGVKWKDTCWWWKYLSMKCIWYIPGILFFSPYLPHRTKKTISYHKNTKLNRFVSLFFHYILSLSLFFNRNLPQSFHCRLQWASRVDSADSNTKIRQLNTKYCTNMCFVFSQWVQCDFLYRNLMFIMCISMP